MKVFKTLLLNIGFVIMFMLKVMLKWDIIAVLLEDIRALHMEIVISKVN